ncbi:MAG: cardiolipin synthase [Oscillospiraceae bacterium]|nr:cardiolipin synthase [Oscillospiraceae bacterium]
MKKLFQFRFHRTVIVALLLLLQILLLVEMILSFRNYFVSFYGISILISLAASLSIINNKSDPAYKIAWLVPILLFPLFGGLFYLMFGINRLTRRQKRKMAIVNANFEKIDGPASAMEQLRREEEPQAALQAQYICNYAHCPPYRNTATKYLASGEEKFECMVEALKKAEHYIFLEYFIIEEGVMWNAILDILKEKAAQGLDVRVMYDDVGSLMTLPAGFGRALEAAGISCCVFNPFVPILSMQLNNRDHRKICVIDGHTGFTGGINLADEYINAVEKHGHWKDTAIMLKGEAVWSLTVTFLSLWDFSKGISEDYSQFFSARYLREIPEAQGYVQPFTDSPLDDESVGETVYLNMVNKAERYVYITTPYLIISSEMVTALKNAAKSGVDVRIITPHIADKWFVHAVTRAYYEALTEAGVKIYEYTPGFIHAKTFVVDDRYGVVGTINLDYRSLYLHFECAVWMYNTASIPDIYQDFLKTLEKSQEVTLEECRKVKWYRKLGRSILRVFAPLM